VNLFRHFLALFVVSDAERLANLGLGGWRPISTAPRDGTDILATGRFISHAVISWRHEEYGRPAHWEFAHVNDERVPNPSHWMPLPTPPGCEFYIGKRGERGYRAVR